jgi:tripartite-type tricarboxylate transporter receptor subunit TctC
MEEVKFWQFIRKVDQKTFSKEHAMKRRIPQLALCGIAFIITFPTNALGAEFYKGKTIRFIVSSPPGGGYDLYSRLQARHLPKHIPGKPRIIVQNMPGGGHLIATRYMYSVAKRDGLTISSLSRSIPHQEIFMGQNKAQFRSVKFNWLGSTTEEVQVCLVRSELPIKKFEDLKTAAKPVAMGGQGRGIEPSDYGRMVREIFKANIHVVDGYKGTGPRRLALEQKEIDGVCGWSWSSVKGTSQHWLDSGFIRILAQLGLRPHPELTKMGVPFLLDMAPNKEARQIMKVLFSRLAVGRPVLTTPGVPKGRVAVLRTAFQKTWKDPAFLDEAKRLGLEVNPMSGDEVEKLIRSVFDQPPELLERVTEIVMGSK